MTKPFYHAAIGIILNPQKQILISKRPLHKLGGGLWEFPGGKIENGETPQQALVRELEEEVGIQVLKVEKLLQYHHDYLGHSALLEIFIVLDFGGQPRSAEGQEIQWITEQEFSNYQFLEANNKVIEYFLAHRPAE